MWAGKAAIQVRQARGGERSPAQLGFGTQSLTVFVDDVDGHYAGAKAAYEAALVDRPNSGFGLYGLARVAELQGDAAGAKSEYAAFLKEWAAADAGLPELAHARSVVGGEVAGSR